MNAAKVSSENVVLLYEGTGKPSAPTFFSREIPRSEYQGDYDSLPEYNAPGMPWHLEPYEPPDPTGVANDQLLSTVSSQIGTLLRALKKVFPDKDFYSVFKEALLEEIDPPEWSAVTAYTFGDVVLHKDRRYIALQDVKTSVPPDNVYDTGTATGGWMPV